MMIVPGRTNKSFEIAFSQVETMIENFYANGQACIVYLIHYQDGYRSMGSYLATFELGRVWTEGGEIHYRVRPNMDWEVARRAPQIMGKDDF